MNSVKIEVKNGAYIKDRAGNRKLVAGMGSSSKGAYEEAVEGGYSGTKEEFQQQLAEAVSNPTTTWDNIKDKPKMVLPITQDEYDALSAEDKNNENIVYLILDNNNSGSLGGNANSMSYNFSDQFETKDGEDGGVHVSLKCATDLADSDSLPVSLGVVKELAGNIETLLAAV